MALEATVDNKREVGVKRTGCQIEDREETGAFILGSGLVTILLLLVVGVVLISAGTAIRFLGVFTTDSKGIRPSSKITLGAGSNAAVGGTETVLFVVESVEFVLALVEVYEVEYDMIYANSTI